MSSSFSSRVLRTRSFLQRYAGAVNAPGNPQPAQARGGNKRLYRSCSSSLSSHDMESGHSSHSRGRQPSLSFPTTTSAVPEHSVGAHHPTQQQLQRHDRQRHYFSSSTNATNQESSSADLQIQVEDSAKMKASIPAIDPNELEIKRRKVKDVSRMNREIFYDASP